MCLRGPRWATDNQVQRRALVFQSIEAERWPPRGLQVPSELVWAHLGSRLQNRSWGCESCEDGRLASVYSTNFLRLCWRYSVCPSSRFSQSSSKLNNNIRQRQKLPVFSFFLVKSNRWACMSVSDCGSFFYWVFGSALHSSAAVISALGFTLSPPLSSPVLLAISIGSLLTGVGETEGTFFGLLPCCFVNGFRFWVTLRKSALLVTNS